MKEKGGVYITVRDEDKQEVIPIAEKFEQLGFDLYASPGTALTLNQNMIATNAVRKLSEKSPNVMDLLESGRIDYGISTCAKGRIPSRDSVRTVSYTQLRKGKNPPNHFTRELSFHGK